jgi:hypothetical protein
MGQLLGSTSAQAHLPIKFSTGPPGLVAEILYGQPVTVPKVLVLTLPDQLEP